MLVVSFKTSEEGNNSFGDSLKNKSFFNMFLAFMDRLQEITVNQ